MTLVSLCSFLATSQPADALGPSTCAIYVASTPIPGVPGVKHLFFIFAKYSGTWKYTALRAGPQSRSNYGSLTVTGPAPYSSGFVDYPAEKWVQAGTTSLATCWKITTIEWKAQRIHMAAVPYAQFGPNSNTFVGSLLRTVGLPLVAPVASSLAPGFTSSALNQIVPTLTWMTEGSWLRGQVGSARYRCPANPQVLWLAWGGGPYHDGSSICTAALHAGLITARAGGFVTVRPTGVVSSFAASTRNGVRNGSAGAGYGFTFG